MKINRSLPLVAVVALALSPVLESSVHAQSPAQNFVLDFNGVDGSVTVPHTAALNAYPLTIMCWFKTTQTNTTALVNKYYASSLSGYQIYIDQTGIHAWYFRHGANHVYGGLDGGPVADGQWHHVAFVVDEVGGRLYLDGTQRSALAWLGTPGATTTTEPLRFGQYIGAANGFYAGELDELSVWNTSLSAAQIQSYGQQPLAGNEAGLLGYWRFNEPDGSIATNSASSGSAYDGSLSGGVTRIALPATVTITATGTAGNRATLNGSVNAQGLPSTGWFEWGATPNFGEVTSAQSVSGDFSQIITGLVVGATYYFRAVASNSLGTGFGATHSFVPHAFENINAPFPGSYLYGPGIFTAWADYDQDGLLDIILGNYEFEFPEFPVRVVGRNYLFHSTASGFENATAIVPGLRDTGGGGVWVDHDKDGRLDLLSGNNLWRNTTDGFVKLTDNIPTGLMAGGRNPAAIGDYDNDGRDDLLIVGQALAGMPAQIWRNTLGGFVNVTTVVAPGLSTFSASAAAWGDYDNDGRLDFLIAAGFDANAGIQIWRNTGGSFSNVTAAVAPGLSGVSSSVAWGDYDNDGRLDFVVGGYGSIALPAQVWRNTGAGFTNALFMSPFLEGFLGAMVALGDYDNDGRLDLLMAGGGSVFPFGVRVWRNTPEGFTDVTSVVAPGLAALGNLTALSAAWGDYDNDGRLDILISARLGGSGLFIAQVWKNHTAQINTPPTAPTALTVAVGDQVVTLRWNAGSDAATPADGLTYSLRVGTTPGGGEIIDPLASADGLRRVPILGNRQQARAFDLKGSQVGQRYYWSVQAVDGAFAGSPFASASFALGGLLLPPSGVLTPGDTDGDGAVNQDEFAAVLNHLNGNGIVSQSDLNLVLSNYWADSGLAMINIVGLGGTNVSFALSNAGIGPFTVLSSTNLADWELLGPAIPRYEFTDTNTPALPQRYYRLRWP